MAIPDKPLIIVDYDPDELTLDEDQTLFGDEYRYTDMRQFLIEHIDHKESWTIAEIGKLKNKEINAVRVRIYEAIVEIRKKQPPLAERPAEPSPISSAGQT